jgi:hypothetical protein
MSPEARSWLSDPAPASMSAEFDGLPLVHQRYGRLHLAPVMGWEPARSRYCGYSSFRQLRGSAGCAFGVRSSRKLK